MRAVGSDNIVAFVECQGDNDEEINSPAAPIAAANTFDTTPTRARESLYAYDCTRPFHG